MLWKPPGAAVYAPLFLGYTDCCGSIGSMCLGWEANFYNLPPTHTAATELFNVLTIPTMLIRSGNGGRSCHGQGMHWNVRCIGLCMICATAKPLSFWFVTTTGCFVWTTDKHVGYQGRPVS